MAVHHRPLGSVFTRSTATLLAASLAAVLAPLGSTFADITATGDVSPVYDGLGDLWEIPGNLEVGHTGVGSLTVSDGAVINATTGYIGTAATASGDITVTGVGSQLNLSGRMFLGLNGAGELHIEDGGYVQLDRFDASLNTGSSSLVRVVGQGSVLEMTSRAYLGNFGPSRLEVLDGASLLLPVVGSELSVGRSSIAPSQIVIDGVGTNAFIGGEFEIATGNTSTLDLTGGASLTTGSVRAGIPEFFDFESPAIGVARLNIAGSATTWQANGDFLLGGTVQSELAVSDNARVNITGDLFTGADQGAGSVRVSSQATVQATGQALIGFGSETLDFHSGTQSTLHLDAGTLSANALLVRPDHLSGNGTVQTMGWILDMSGTHNSISSLPSQVLVSDGNATNVDVQMQWLGSVGLFGAGYRGNGDQTLDGFSLDSTHGVLGFGSASSGRVAVDGEGTSWITERLTIGHGGEGELVISDGGLVRTDVAVLGEREGSSGKLTIQGGTFQSVYSSSRVATTHIGRSGSGEVIVGDGGLFKTSEIVTLGSEKTGFGTVTVQANGTWDPDETYVGDLGRGKLILEPGATVDGSISLGRNNYGHGELILKQGTHNTLSSFVSVGNGQITLEPGTSIEIGRLSIGAPITFLIDSEDDPPAPPTGSLVATGPGTYFGTGRMFIGDSNAVAGIAQLSNGAAGRVYRDLSLGDEPGSYGELVLDGLGTSFRVDDEIWVGNEGHGQLVVNEGATIDAMGIVRVGRYETANGHLLIKGQDATFNAGLVNFENNQSISSLQVSDGGLMNSTGRIAMGGLVGQGPAAPIHLNGGTINAVELWADFGQIHGSGTINADYTLLGGNWVIDPLNPLPSTIVLGDAVTMNLTWNGLENGAFGAGFGGSGHVTLRGSYIVQSDSGLIGTTIGSHGVVDVEGVGTRWTATGTLKVGGVGYGELNIRDGGVVEARNIEIGGLVRLVGPGSKLIADRDLIIGGEGARLELRDGATLHRTRIEVGRSNSGTLDIAGPETRFASDIIQVGDFGHGVLHVGDGAFADFGHISLAAFSGIGSAQMIVDGLGTVTESGSLSFATSGSGELNVTNGATLITSDFFMGDRGISNATATIDGDASRWEVESQARILNGSVFIQAGGEWRTGDTLVGLESEATPEVSINGHGSHWRVTGGLTAGDQYQSSLTIKKRGTSQILGDLLLGDLNTLVLETPHSGIAPLLVNGNSTISGALGLRVDSNALPADGSEVVLIDVAGTASGAFVDLDQGDLVDVFYGIGMRINYNSGDGNDITALIEHLIDGDLNASGATDQDDLDIVLALRGATVEQGDWGRGDINNDGFVNDLDVDAVVANWTGSIAPFVPADGDLDWDGDVDFDDINLAISNFTGHGGSESMLVAQGDFDYDGDVDNKDMGFIFGAYTGPLIPAADAALARTAVPEPSSLVLLGLGGVFVLRGRRAA